MNKIKNFYSTKRVQKIGISILAVLVMLGGITFAVCYKPASPSNVKVAITLASKDIKEKVDVDVNIIVNANVEILNNDGTLVEDVSMAVNKPTTLSTALDVGTYKFHMTSAPIESDGSTYKIPSKIDNIVISDEDVNAGHAMDVSVTLERIAVADMTKEQLDITINRINKETPDENKELIEDLTKRKETAVSDATSGDDTKQDTDVDDTPQAEDTPKTETKPDTPKPENKPSNGGNTGSSGGNTPSKHEHTWTPNVVNHPAIPAQGYTETIPAVTKSVPYFIYDDGCKFEKKNSYDENASAMSKHNREHGMQGYRGSLETVILTPASSRWVETAPAQPAWSETTGHTCGCGASK